MKFINYKEPKDIFEWDNYMTDIADICSDCENKTECWMDFEECIFKGDTRIFFSNFKPEEIKMRTKQEIQDAIDRIGEHGKWKVEDCDICENGAVYYGLIQIIEPY